MSVADKLLVEFDEELAVLLKKLTCLIAAGRKARRGMPAHAP